MYLKKYKIAELLRYDTEILIIGSGIAGLTAAVAAAEKKRQITLISKTKLNSGSTPHAQGGIAVVYPDNPDDSFDKHITDTLNAGADLCNKSAVEILVKEGSERIIDLINWGIEFDKINETKKLHFTKEAAHNANRILHCSGDATGREIEFGLIKKMRQYENIFVKEHIFAIDLVAIDQKCVGCICYDDNTGQYIFIHSQKTILAGGGIGQLYRETTNPEEITGDTIAMAYRCGATLVDLEFIQFHPTTFYYAGAPRFLISESVRGEGGYLINKNKERFMFKYHSAGELAARDIVSRAISQEMINTDSANVYLDLTHLSEKLIETRFPNIMNNCLHYGIDIRKDYIPVRPAEHYFMGGIKTNLFCETDIEDLLACGECACVGTHGANRLASNSLLEGLVFGYRAGLQAVETFNWSTVNLYNLDFAKTPLKKIAVYNIDDAKNSIKSLMWRKVGIFRNDAQLNEALITICKWKEFLLNNEFNEISGYELQNQIILAELIVRAALLRDESRGAHYRTDFPQLRKDYNFKHFEFNIKNENNR